MNDYCETQLITLTEVVYKTWLSFHVSMDLLSVHDDSRDKLSMQIN